jgi:hypothetical protein
MPIFRITYTTPRTDNGITEDLEWIAPSEWNAQQTEDCFKRRYPDASVIRFQEICTHPY